MGSDSHQQAFSFLGGGVISGGFYVAMQCRGEPELLHEGSKCSSPLSHLYPWLLKGMEELLTQDVCFFSLDKEMWGVREASNMLVEAVWNPPNLQCGIYLDEG